MINRNTHGKGFAHLCTGLAAIALLLGCATTQVSPVPGLPPIPSSLGISVNRVDGLPADFMMGADISMLAQIEAAGGKFYREDNTAEDALEILRDHGVNWVRLRIWNNPVFPKGLTSYHGTNVSPGPTGGGNCDLDTITGLAKRARNLGMKVFLAFHYSDFWADPGKQDTPAAWIGLPIDKLADALGAYTRDVLTRMKAAGAAPDIVGIGNEVNNGICWNDGMGIISDKNSSGGYLNFIRLLNSGAAAVRTTIPQARIMIHIAEGGNTADAVRFFDNVAPNVDFDCIGLSFYPYWHGTVSQLATTMDTLTARFNKPVIVAETAYAYTDKNADSQSNSWSGTDPAGGGFLVSSQGQATALRDVIAAVARVPANRGLGVFYWEPDWIPVEGAGWITGQANGWENQALWDFAGKPLPSMWTFRLVSESKTAFEAKITSVPEIKKETTLGTGPVLPATVGVFFSDASYRQTAVKWDAINPSQYATVSNFIVKGAIAGTTQTAVANVVVIPVNYAINGGFETGKLDPWTSSAASAGAGVTVFGVEASSPSANTHSGSFTGTFWFGSAYTFDMRQKITGLAPGNYTFSAYAMGDGKPVSLGIYSESGTVKKTAAVSLTGWQKWQKFTVSGIVVDKSGTVIIGFEGTMAGGDWGKLDDVTLNKE